ncbi:MAG TPA: DoxX family membrane protein [Candidatus Binatia bacterium]|jgi:hypothetical protein|nr:DoxX family membrane protein [Candidatus Binatia bacterium]
MDIQKKSRLLLRVGLGLTFVGIGVYIFMDPLAWGSIMQPWAMKLVGPWLVPAMYANGAFDVAVGLMLIAGLWTWLAAAFGALHIFSVLVVAGVSAITVRDIGLLCASLALALDTLPPSILAKLAPAAVSVPAAKAGMVETK